MFRFLILIFLIFKTSNTLAQGYDVFSIGIFDVKFDGSSSYSNNYAADFRYERRFDNTLIDIGPKEDNFFYLKPFAGIEGTSDSASFLIAGVYLEDNVGTFLIFGGINICLPLSRTIYIFSPC